MEAMKQLMINGRKYALRMFSPMEAFEFIHDFRYAQANGMNAKALALRAIGQCNDEMGRSLGDTGTFEANFSKYPTDMMELEDKVIEELIAPFAKKDPDTKGNAKS